MEQRSFLLKPTMTIGVLSGLPAGVHLWQFFSGLRNSDSKWDGSVRCSCKPVVTVPIISSGTDGMSLETQSTLTRNSGSSRDLVAACAMLEGVTLSAPGSGVLVERMSSSGSQGMELSPGGDPATSLERSILETQWAISLGDHIERGLRNSELLSLKNETENLDEENLRLPSTLRNVIRSGRPRARSRRLKAKQQVASINDPRSPADPLSFLPGSQGQEKRYNTQNAQGYLLAYWRQITTTKRLTSDEERILLKVVRTGYLMEQERMKLVRAVGHDLTKLQWAAFLHLKVPELDAKLREIELARERLVIAHLRLVVSIAKQFDNKGVEMADLIQLGSIGLLKGLERFDFNRGYKLSTYVHWWILKGVTQAITEHSRAIRLPAHVHETLRRTRKTRARMLGDGDPATVENLGVALNLTDEQTRNVLKFMKNPRSLDSGAGNQRNFMAGDSDTLHSVVADRQTENQPWSVVGETFLKADVDRILNTYLGTRERDIIKMQFGVDCQDGNPISLEKIGHIFGISRVRVGQLARAAQQKLLAAPTGFDKNSYLSI